MTRGRKLHAARYQSSLATIIRLADNGNESEVMRLLHGLDAEEAAAFARETKEEARLLDERHGSLLPVALVEQVSPKTLSGSHGGYRSVCSPEEGACSSPHFFPQSLRV